MTETPAGIGHNHPPTQIETITQRITDLAAECRMWLDGEPINSQGLADGVTKLEGMVKAAIKEADALRAAEYVPLNEAKAAVQALFEPLIGGSKCDGGIAARALSACREALKPWLLAQRAAAEAKAAAVRAEADAKAAELAAARAIIDKANLAQIEEANRLADESAKLERIAAASEKKATTKTGLRTTYRAEVTDWTVLARHVWMSDPDGLNAFLLEWASKAVCNAGKLAATMTIPGVSIISEERVA